MAYTRPNGDSVNFQATGVAYTRPDGVSVNFSFATTVEPEAHISLCSIFSVINNAVQLTTASVSATDTFRNGVLTTTAQLNRAIASGGDEYTNGLLLTDAGQVRYVDATAGLPADTVWSNGLPKSGGALCISTDPVSTYSNGIPFAANGAVAAAITP